MQKKSRLSESINIHQIIHDKLNDNIELLELAEEEKDEESIAEIAQDIKILRSKAEEKEIECMFSGEADDKDCFLEIHAGAGGTESHDWSEMLLRMYMRWAEKKNFKPEIANQIVGEEAGIKSVTIKITGDSAYGYLRSESGIHRLVRQSPFNAQNKRQTSFASVWVYPVIDDDIEAQIEIQDKDLRIDTFRASGAGGQHVNTTDSAVRITHIPSKIVVSCQNERSQHKNKAAAMKMLKSRLYERELKKRQEEIDEQNAQKTEIGWGHQIRSYVLHPYKMVKDLRTNYETSNTGAVLDGDIDNFMLEMLKFEAVRKHDK